ncbi:fumarylacetoacetate hydrolase family protein [Deinococcus cellulosilyticus]|uniref:Ureidoglycolate lyase n=1 Tax=Deinococcus cellulosilyticus (strain DSM 18568 / NBRC 106333 / KACC 11606 / 5516J-15) TaxID=1223518 RepID=A0A511MWJ4_DEIC1|nr:fumarylacetoacetate hydrolase family protein [Deinococcus cellulosilyticus]GEM44638.1 ureidoglycolate lyase [Deinococcus cellulosilyticus NBRC 106333 = KACC 11606]
MKLLRFGEAGQEKPGLHDGQVIRDLSAVISDVHPATLGDSALQKLRDLDPSSLPEVPGNPRIGPCVAGVGKFICIGLNYKDHADETGAAYPKEPIIFMKATSAIQGPHDTLLIPRNSRKTDWEVELGVVIGTAGKYIPVEEALNHVAGYCTVNDVSEREFQMERGGTWDKGKGCDTFGPIGPYLVTRDEVPDPQNLKLWLEVDGHRYQEGTTANMIFTVAELVSYVSQFMSLQPGDIISTGTPAGVGLGQKPEPVYLKEGQTLRLAVEGLGEQVQKVAQDA